MNTSKNADSFCGSDAQELPATVRDWFASGAGDHLRQRELILVETMMADIFGYRMLVLDGAGIEDALDECPIRRRIRVTALADAGREHSIRADAHELPIASDSIDAVVLPHTLDYAADPRRILREVERVLIPEGRVLIIGFNPLSLWGLWRIPRRLRGGMPWCGHFLSYRRIQDWLSLLGCDVERTDVCAFAPPVAHAGLRERLAWLESLGYRVWPMLAGVYVVRAVKRISTLRPVGKVWRPLRSLRPRAVRPTAREVKDV